MPTELINFPVLNYVPLAPILVVMTTAIIVMIVDMLTPDKSLLGYVSLCGLIGALMPSFVLLYRADAPKFQNMLVSDGYAAIFYLIFIFAAFLSVLIAQSYLSDRNMEQGEYYVLLLLATSGMMLMAGATDLIIVFLGLEIMSIALYILAGFNRHQISSGEAGLKYFLLGAFASAFFLYGVALVYGATGSTNLHEIGARFGTTQVNQHDPIALIGLALLLIGFSFKIAAVPFQWWTPDVYQGAPTSATAFMSVGAKAAGFAALVRLLMTSFGDVFAPDWQLVVAFLAVITMTGGNIAALAQKDVKRMLAYSSIAHAGYLLVGVVAVASGKMDGVSGILLYLMSYTFMNIGAFTVVAILEHKEKVGASFSDYTGLSTRQPLLALAMLFFMFGLTGIPPFIGFWGKWYVFWAAVEANWSILAYIGMFNSAISAFYYLSIVIQMYMRIPDNQIGATPLLPIKLSPSITLALVITAAVTLIFGLWPTPLINLMALGIFG